MYYRYPGLAFNPYAVEFRCPRCVDNCNCTSCCNRRGETYISARVGKLPPPGSDEARALLDEAAAGTLGFRRPATPPPTRLDLPPGAFFGVVYGLHGQRVGQGYVDRDKEHVLIKARRKKVVAYIGKKRVPAVVAPVPPVSAPMPAPMLPQPAPSSSNQDASQDGQAAPLPSVAPVQAATERQANATLNEAESIPVPAPHESSSQASRLTPPPDAPAGAPLLRPAEVPRPVSSPPPVLRGRLYIGKRTVLDSSLYVSMKEVISRALRQEDDLNLHAPQSDPIPAEGGGGVAPSLVEVQCAIAIALQAADDPKAAQMAAVADATMS